MLLEYKLFNTHLHVSLTIQTNHILINMDIRNDQEEEEDPLSKKGKQEIHHMYRYHMYRYH